MGERYIIKKGDCYRYGWQARYDEKLKIYTFLFEGAMSGTRILYEITKEMFDEIVDESENADEIGQKGRKMYMHVCDICGPEYTVVFDDDYLELAPWAKDFLPIPEKDSTWSEEMTDAVIDVMTSEKNNREQRHAKRKKREEKQ